jgi:hypothetical protein
MEDVVVFPCMPQMTIPFLAFMMAASASARRTIGKPSFLASS